MNQMPRETVLQLALAAIAAPSADNHHVFRLASHGGCIDVLALHAMNNAAPNRRILGLISIGAVVENMRLRAAALGWHLDVEWKLDGVRQPLLAVLRPVRKTMTEDPLEAQIAARHTNRRRRFRGPTLDAAALAAFEARQVPNTRLVWLDAPNARRSALRLIRLAEAERFRNCELHRDLFDSIRFDVPGDRTAEQGLPIGALELPLLERAAFLMLRRWPVQRLLNLGAAHRMIAWMAADLPCRSAPHLGAIYAEGPPETAAVAAGARLQRAWLTATALGQSFQVFAASPLYALDGSDSIDPSMRARLAAGWAALSPGGRAMTVFRMGRAAAPTVRAGRRAAESVLTL